VVANGTTIGDASSLASQLKDPKTWPLFNLLYVYFNDTLCPVTPGGRSGNALNDFNAHKAIRVPDLRGRQMVGDDVMQNVAANVLPGATTGLTGGAATRQIAVTNLPAAQVAVSGSTDPSGIHSHTYDRTSRTPKNAASGSGVSISEADTPISNNTGSTGSHIHPFTGLTANLGSGTALATMDPYFVLSFYIKL
jgi:microcystin-dependent protein